MGYEILTCKNRIPHEWYTCYREFLRSCDRHSLRPIFLEGEWRGMVSKLKFLWNYLQAGKHTGKHVIFCDCFDLVFGQPYLLSRPNDLWPMLMERFRSFNVPFVANCEMNCFPFPETADQYPPSPTKWRFLNSGFFIAETDAMVEILRFINPLALGEGEDQEEVQRAFLAQPVPMKLDYEGLLCRAMHALTLEDVLISQYTGFESGNYVDVEGSPLAFHFNGKKDTPVMPAILKALRL
jgi:hypothetical protein